MNDIFLEMAVIAAGSALAAWIACRLKQPVILGYFVCGLLIGPIGLHVITDVDFLQQISRIGITLLLFLAGLVLHPNRLNTFFKTALVVTLGSCIVTIAVVFPLLRLFSFSVQDSIWCAAALMFSSTILVVKLLPTTTLHQQRMGSICIAILILQDLLAIIALMLLGIHPGQTGRLLFLLPVKVAAVIFSAALIERFALRWMMRKVDRFNEVLLMLCLGWCLSVAAAAEAIGISYEVGAFVAGVVMAQTQIARVLSEQLKPLRDFFLMFFFFVLGAQFDPFYMQEAWIPALILSLIIIAFRPWALQKLFIKAGEKPDFSKETGVRLGQASEFALIIALAAVQSGHLSMRGSQLLQLVTIGTMILSSYIVVRKYPSPIGVTPKLHRD